MTYTLEIYRKTDTKKPSILIEGLSKEQKESFETQLELDVQFITVDELFIKKGDISYGVFRNSR